MKPKQTHPMTENTLLDALQAALKVKGATTEGRTVQELSEASGVHIARVRAGLKQLIRDGKCFCSYQYRESIAGYMRRAPVYIMRK